MVHEGSNRMNFFQYSGPSCRVQSAAGAKVMSPDHYGAELGRAQKGLRALVAARASNIQSGIQSLESYPPAGPLRTPAEKTKTPKGSDPPPEHRLGGGAIGRPRAPVAGLPVLRGLEHRVVAAPETLSTAYRAQQEEPQKVFLEKIAGAGAVALKTATAFTAKLTGSHILSQSQPARKASLYILTKHGALQSVSHAPADPPARLPGRCVRLRQPVTCKAGCTRANVRGLALEGGALTPERGS
jgi:hypothetical protein